MSAPVVFIHPINLSGPCWKEVGALLDPAREAIMPDMRGHGAATAAGPFGAEHWADDVTAAIELAGFDRLHLVGGSLGGALAVLVASRLPDRVLSIASLGGTLHVEGADLEAVVDLLQKLGVRGMFEAVLPELSVAPGTSQAVIDRVLSLTNPNDVDTVTAIWKAALATDLRDKASAVRCPALVVNGELDKTCPPAQGRQMANALGVELTVLDGVGHLPMLEAPARTAALVSDHLVAAEKEASHA